MAVHSRHCARCDKGLEASKRKYKVAWLYTFESDLQPANIGLHAARTCTYLRKLYIGTNLCSKNQQLCGPNRQNVQVLCVFYGYITDNVENYV